MKFGFVEKREYKRVIASLIARYSLLTDVHVRNYHSNPEFVHPVDPDDKHTQGAATSDLSAGGLALVGPDLFRAGYKVLVTFIIPDHPPEVSAVTEVRWVQQFMEGAVPKYRAGLKFLLIRKNDVERLKSYLVELEKISKEQHPPQ